MKKILFGLAFVLALLAIVALAAWLSYPSKAVGGDLAANQQQHDATGFGADSARIDSQVTLRIPEGEADAVYEYLKEKYVGKDPILQESFSGAHLYGQKMSDTSIFTDEYFDTPNLDLYRTTNSARHRKRVNTTNPDDRKSGRELVQMKVTPPGEFTLRSELKYEVPEDLGPVNSRDDLHPLIRFVDPKLRDDFKKVYTDVGINPQTLRHIFTITQTRRRGYINWDDKNIFSFSVDQGSAGILWTDGKFSSVDLGLVEVTYTEANEERRKTLWAIRDAAIADLKAKFPNLVQTTDSKYGIVLEQLMEQFPLIPLLLRAGVI